MLFSLLSGVWFSVQFVILCRAWVIFFGDYVLLPVCYLFSDRVEDSFAAYNPEDYMSPIRGKKRAREQQFAQHRAADHGSPRARTFNREEEIVSDDGRKKRRMREPGSLPRKQARQLGSDTESKNARKSRNKK